MKIMETYRLRIIINICLSFFILFGCKPEEQFSSSVTSTPIRSSHLIATEIPNTHTPIPTPFKPTPIPTVIIPTSLPTIPPDEIDAAINEIVETNGGCLLPCWWGISPGETTWIEAKQFLDQYNAELSSSERIDHIVDNHSHTITYYSADLYTEGFPRGVGARFEVWDDHKISSIYTSGQSTGSSLEINNLLSTYGRPKRVSISITPHVPDNIFPFYLVLFYPDEYFGVAYDLLATKQGSIFNGCPKGKIPRIWMWATDSSNLISLEYIQNALTGYNTINIFIDLESASNFSMDEFYLEFLDPMSEACIESHADLWH
jgi:hypothetical protein